MRVAVYRLRFPHGVHVGAYGIGTEGVRLAIPADTFFSALLSAWISLGNDPDPWIKQFPHTADGDTSAADPPFLLTSAFPFVGDTILFPKPIDPERPVPEECRKEWKKVAYISGSVLEEIAEGTPIAELLEKSKFLQGGKVLVSRSEAKELAGERIWEERQIPRVALDRISSASNLYQVGRVDFARGCGLWFGVIWLDPDRPCDGHTFREALELALTALSHSGIGGERTYGYGVFKHELLKEEKQWSKPRPDSPALLLSRYLPRPDELPDVLRDAVGYALEEVRGWTSSPYGQYRRRSIVMISEGSVLRPKSEVMGHIVDVGPLDIETKKPLLPHPVWRYGLAALWPLGGEG